MASVPDRGWAWIIVTSSFAVQALTIGITYTFGIIYVDLLDYYQCSEATAAWIGSIQPTLLYLTGVVGGPLLSRYGGRPVSMVGSLLSGVGFVCSAYAPNIYVLYVTYGAMTGVGFGLQYVTSMVVVQQWFDRRRALASGLAVSGSGAGTLAFGFLTPRLLQIFNWRHTLLVLGGISAVLGLLCSVLLRPFMEEESLTDKEEAETTTHAQSRPEMISDSEERTPLLSNGGLHSPPNGTIQTEPYHYDTTTVGIESANSEEADQVGELKPNDALSNNKSGDKAEKSSDSGPTLLLNPVFLLYGLVMLMFCLGYHVPYTFTPERAERKFHISKDKSSLLVAIMGIANVGGRLVFGVIGDRSKKTRYNMFGLVLLLLGAASSLMFLFTNYVALVVYSGLFGAFSGCVASLYPVMMVDLLGTHVMAKAIGQGLALASFAFLFASPVSGVIIHGTGNYDLPFVIFGLVQVLASAIFFSIKIVIQKFPHYYLAAGDEERFHAIKDNARARRMLRPRYASGTFS